MRLRTCVSAFYCLLGLASAQAATVTVSIAQNAEAPATALEMSRTVEDEIMGVFYDSGHIVTSNALSMNDSAFDDLSFGVAEASEGFADYLVTVRLTYKKDEITDEAREITYADLKTLTWRVVKLSTGTMIAGDTVKLPDGRSGDTDPYQRARATARRIAVDSIKAIDREYKGETER